MKNKMKTHKGSKKRFRVSATGKLKRGQAGKRHLRGLMIDTGKIAAKYVQAMGGKC